MSAQDPISSNNLVQRLRDAVSYYDDNDEDLFTAAADEIERLRRRIAEQDQLMHQLGVCQTCVEREAATPSEPSAALVAIARELKQLRALDRAVLATHRAAVPPSEIRSLFHKAVGIQDGTHVRLGFETQEEAIRAFEYLENLGDMPSETKEATDPYKRCQHDLLAPATTIEVIDKWKAKCLVCIEFFDLPGRPGGVAAP